MKRAHCLILLLALLAGCELRGQPDPAQKFVSPDKVLDFAALYGKNCAGCHGKEGKLGPAPPLNDAVFLAIVPEDQLVKTIAAGRKGTSMPAFAKEQGGTLTDAQVKVLAQGLRSTWGDAAAAKKDWPAYILPVEKGNAERGRAVFDRACAHCHGKDGLGSARHGPIHDKAFLTLTSEQFLRRLVITGRADLGMPNCAEGEGRPLSATDVNDLTALLMSWKN